MKTVASLSSKILFIIFIYVFLDEYVFKGDIRKYIDNLYSFYSGKKED